MPSVTQARKLHHAECRGEHHIDPCFCWMARRWPHACMHAIIVPASPTTRRHNRPKQRLLQSNRLDRALSSNLCAIHKKAAPGA